MNLVGYKRPDGKVGIRNKVLILPTCVCSTETCAKISREIEGTISFTNQNGCSQTNEDVQYTIDVLVGFAANPNIYGTIVVGLGCEVCSAHKIAGYIRERTNKPLYEVIIQEDGGTLGAIEKASNIARQLVEEASKVSKVPISIEDIVLATECGGSDSTSGLAANPTIGYVCDKLVEQGGTAILSETPEFIGAEHILASRAANEEIANQILNIVYRCEDYFMKLNTNLRDSNPAPGNKKGGISSLEEKSLGCIYKGGSTPVKEVVDYAKEITGKGLVIMDTPGNDTASLTAMAAGGAQLAIFSTGRGTPVGNPIMPVIKITGNKETYAKMLCNIDFNASPMIDGEATLEELGEQLYNEMSEVINGKVTKAEAFKMNEIGIARFCNFT